MRKEIHKNSDKKIKLRSKNVTPFDNEYLTIEEECRNEAHEEALRSFNATMELGIDLMLRYKTLAIEKGLFDNTGEKIVRTFMITIRPHCQRVTFNDFRQDVQEFIQRKMIEHVYALTFEQKGMCEGTLGTGFHVHFIAKTSCRSKAELIENTYSTFKRYTEKHCIDARVCKTPDEVKQDYLIDYKSKDGHKEKTKEWDTLWRKRNNIEPIYNNDDRGNIWEKRALIKSDAGTLIFI